MVSVGSGDLRFRQSYKLELEAKEAELAALKRMNDTGNPLEASVRPEDLKPRGKLLKDAYELTWRLYWSQDRSSKTHQVNARQVFRLIPEGLELTVITPELVLDAIEEWEDMGNSGSTVNRKISNLRMMLKTARDQGWIQSVPKLPMRTEGKHRIRWMNETEELKVLAACSHLGLDELYDFICTAIDTGFRRGELLGLQPSDFINGNLHLHDGETKSGKGRSVPVTKRVAAILSRRDDQRKVFSLTESSLRRQWGILKDYLGLNDDTQFIVHMLRHTCASRLVQRGVPLAVVKSWMGHANIETTLRYAHLAPDSLMIGRDALEQVKSTPALRVVNG